MKRSGGFESVAHSSADGGDKNFKMQNSMKSLSHTRHEHSDADLLAKAHHNTLIPTHSGSFMISSQKSLLKPQNTSDLKHMKVYNQFSPGTLKRMVKMQKKAKRF